MFERVAYKKRAKDVLRKNYWMCFLASLIVLVLKGNVPEFTVKFTETPDIMYEGIGLLATPMVERLIAWFALAGGLLVIAVIAGIAFKILVSDVMSVGIAKYYLEARKENFEVKSIGFVFQQPHYWNIVKIIFVQNLLIFLWTLLLIIPGIIKAYQLRFIPYILAENPEIDMHEAFELAKRLSKDIKMDLFIMDLSFLGWILLSAFSFGLGQFFLHPYTEATNAEAYAAQLRHASTGHDVY